MDKRDDMKVGEEKKECLHIFHSVYYGNEWEVECEKCNLNVYELYNRQDGTEIINKMIYENSKLS